MIIHTRMIIDHMMDNDATWLKHNLAYLTNLTKAILSFT